MNFKICQRPFEGSQNRVYGGLIQADFPETKSIHMGQSQPLENKDQVKEILQ